MSHEIGCFAPVGCLSGAILLGTLAAIPLLGELDFSEPRAPRKKLEMIPPADSSLESSDLAALVEPLSEFMHGFAIRSPINKVGYECPKVADLPGHSVDHGWKALTGILAGYFVSPRIQGRMTSMVFSYDGGEGKMITQIADGYIGDHSGALDEMNLLRDGNQQLNYTGIFREGSSRYQYDVEAVIGPRGKGLTITELFIRRDGKKLEDYSVSVDGPLQKNTLIGKKLATPVLRMAINGHMTYCAAKHGRAIDAAYQYFVHPM